MTSRRDGASRDTQPPGTTRSIDSTMSTTRDTSSNSIGNSSSESTQPASLRTTAPIPARSSAGTSSGPQSLVASRSPSAVASPWSSRDSSPAPGRRTSVPAAAKGMKSRQNSHDVSPSRPQHPTASNPPSAPALQRPLNTASIPQLLHSAPNTADTGKKLERAPRSHPNANDMGLHWPVSPRLKSPPPGTGPRRSSAQAKTESDAATGLDGAVQETAVSGISTKKDAARQLQLPVKPTPRSSNGPSKLETVQESSQPSTPADEIRQFMAQSDAPLSKSTTAETKSIHSPTKTASLPHLSSVEGAESSDSSARSRRRRADSTAIDPDKTPKAARPLTTKPSQGNIRPKSIAENKNMTVETETVDSVAQAALHQPDRSISGRSDYTGTLKVKASSETIRPKKERKKPSRKAASLNAGNASSRADIFEGQVMDAMDQASSDDSDETFVYESNPPDPPYRSRSRHHSRTPSATSMTSLADQRSGSRTITGMMETQKPMQKARSMKFANNTYHSGGDDDDRQDGTVRAHRGHGSGLYHHHHTGVRSTRGGHTSIIDDDNPTFPNMQKPRSVTGLAGRQSHNARLASQHLRGPDSTVRKNDGFISYDLDDEQADDERTPLVGTVRGARNGRGSIRSPRSRYPYDQDRHRRSLLSRCAGCFVLLIMLFLLASGVIGFMFAVSKPLVEVQVVEIQNVLAIEQQIMLDLVVEAINPNILPINVADMDIEILAKSRYVGSQKWWREHPKVFDDAEANTTTPRLALPQPNNRRLIPRSPEVDLVPEHDGDKNNTNEKTTMLLGRIYHFDTPLSFDGSFWRRSIHHSTGSLRLSTPGKGTELGGSERWERVLKHDFELIIRGSLKYSIPLGGSRHSESIYASVVVHPDSEEADDGDWGDGRLDDVGKVQRRRA